MSKPAAANDKNTDGSRTYRYPPTGENFASVTTILGATHDKSVFLVPWSARLAAERAVDDLENVTRIAATKGREVAVDYLKGGAKEAREMKAEVGSYVHDVAEALVLWAASPGGTGTDIPLPDLPGHLTGVEYDEGLLVEDVAEVMVDGFLNYVSDYQPEHLATEMTVYNPDLKVAGTLDLIDRLPGFAVGPAGQLIPGTGVTACVDIKTGRPEVTWPEQVASYRRSPWALLRTGDMVATPKTDCGCVLHLRPEYPRGYRLMLIAGRDDAQAWNRFRRNVATYYERLVMRKKPGKVCYPLRADGTIPSPLIADLDDEGYGRGLAAVVKALGPDVDVDQVAQMTGVQLLALRGVGPAALETLRAVVHDHGLQLADEIAEFGKVA
jgi:hypothetical protein